MMTADDEGRLLAGQPLQSLLAGRPNRTKLEQAERGTGLPSATARAAALAAAALMMTESPQKLPRMGSRAAESSVGQPPHSPLAHPGGAQLGQVVWRGIGGMAAAEALTMTASSSVVLLSRPAGAASRSPQARADVMGSQDRCQAVGAELAAAKEVR